MEARVGDLAVGTRFLTLLTGRQGRVLDAEDGEPVSGVLVRFDDRAAPRTLHGDVRVRVVYEVH